MVSGRGELGRLGRYELIERLARGGMGTVYLARLSGEHDFEKRLAIKTLQDETAEDERFRRMFLDEVRIASRIDHPHVCAVVDAGSEHGTLYMVMEYCDGITLVRLRRRIVHRLPYAFHARVIADAARGLHAAHELRDDDGRPLGIVHRDVSPQNIMVLRRGGVKVLDFGVARARGRTSKSHTGELKGKIAYAAPEQLRGDPLDRRADVWALGVVLWEACLETHPFEASSPLETRSNVTSRPIPDPASVAADLPEPLAQVLRGALARDPDRRTPTAAAFADALEKYLYDTGVPFGMQQVAEHVAAAWEDDEAEPTEPEGAAAGGVASAAHHPAGRSAGTSEHGRATAPLGDMPRESTAPADEAEVGPEGSEVTTIATRRPGSPAQGRGLHWAWVAGIGTLLAAVGVALGAAVAGSGSEPAPSTSATGSVNRQPTPTEPSKPAPPPAPVREGPPEQGPGAADDDGPATEPTAVPAGSDPVEPKAPRAEPRRAAVRSGAAPEPDGKRDRAASQTEAEPGFVSVFAVPNAQVWLEDEALGETPLRRRVGAGLHRLRLRTEDGREVTRRVRIAPGETERVSVLFDE